MIRESESSYRPDVDGLRAVAILLVVLFHAFPKLLKSGYVGVDIFFVISGFLISNIIFKELLKNHRVSLGHFYIRRINRIFPALILMFIACFCFGWVALFPDEYQQLNKHILGGSSFVSNIMLWNENGYFDTVASTKPLLHLWSLGIEEQFYIFWPILVWLSWKGSFKRLYTLIAIVFFVSFALNIKTVSHDVTAAFYLPQTRFWELLSGSFLAALSLQSGLSKSISKGKEQLFANSQSLIGLLLIVIALLVIKGGKHFPGWGALLPTLGAALIIGAGGRAWFNRAILSNQIVVWIGLISFPLYVWHWPLLSYAYILNGGIPTWQVRIVAVFIAFILAILTYLLVEKPLRSLENKKLSALFLVVFMLFLGLLGFWGYKNKGLPTRPIAHLAKPFTQFGTDWGYSVSDDCLKAYPIQESKKYRWMFCIANKKEKPTMLLLGNSYANHLYAGLVHNQYFKHESILSIGTCDPQWYDKSNFSPTPLTDFPCSGSRPLLHQKVVNTIIEKSGSVKYAILSGLLPGPDEQYIVHIKKRIDFLEKNGVRVIVFVPHLRLPYDIRNCFYRPFSPSKFSCELDVQEHKTILKSFSPLVRSLKKTNPNVVFFDPNQLFCDGSKCSMIRNGMPLFRDSSHHFSVYGSTELAKIFEKWAIANIPEIASSAYVQNKLATNGFG